MKRPSPAEWMTAFAPPLPIVLSLRAARITRRAVVRYPNIGVGFST
jgi:hypothetical protein